MARCQLRIEILGEQDFVRPGGVLDVIVHVVCDSKMECDGLSLLRGWKTHGRGNRDAGDLRMEELFRGTWEPGAYAYPTKVPFPTGPTSFHGAVINVDWFLEARADVPSVAGAKAEATVLLVDPSPPKPYEAPEHWIPTPIKLKTKLSKRVIFSYMALPFVLVLLINAGPIWSLLLIPIALNLIVAYMKRNAAIRAMGQVALAVHPGVIHPGEELHVVLDIRPETELRVEHVRFTLTAEETSTSGSGTTSSIHTEQVYSQENTLGKDMTISSTEPLKKEVAFPLPVTAPHTFKSTDNKVITELVLEIQPVGQNVVKYSQEIHVGLPNPVD